MRFGLFYEHQLPRPWEAGAEARLLSDALEQIELADRSGFDYVWEVEHHFLEEYSHSSAPEVFLGAASQRTKRIRLGHGIVQLPPAFNHPARIAERAATLDLLSGGRVELGTGEASSQMELGGFGVERERKREQWEEALDAVTRLLVEEPFAGIDGRHVRIPPRNLVPKPLQRPHPPLWVACSRRETILLAARNGIGALSFSFVEPEAAKEWVDAYYRTIDSDECVPGGFAVNPNVAVVLPMMCHDDEQTAIDRGIDGAHFFGYSLAHYYVFGEHVPGRTDVWAEFERERAERGFAREIVTPGQGALNVRLLESGLGSLRGAIGTPDQVADLCERYERAGVDQVIFVLQAGRNRHEHICESISLFAERVLPRFAERADEVEARKGERLAGACERALARRAPARTGPDGYVVSPQGEPGPATRAAGGGSNGRASVRSLVRQTGEAAFGSLVRGRSDAQLEWLLAGPGLRLIFKGMERAFVPAQRGGFSGEIQYELRGARGVRRFALAIGDGGVHADERPAREPALTVRTSVPVFARVAAGERSASRALIDGELELSGDFDLAARLGAMFGAERLF